MFITNLKSKLIFNSILFYFLIFNFPASSQLENLAFRSKVVDSTFTNPEFAFDGTGGGMGGTAASGKLSEQEQVLTFELPVAIYLGQMKLTWLHNQNPFKINIEVSPDRQNWIKLTPTQYQTAFSQKYSFSIQNIQFVETIPAKVIRIIVPKGVEGLGSGRNEFSLAEIEVFQNIDKFLEFTKTEFMMASDTEAFVQFNTTIETVGHIYFRKKGEKNWNAQRIVHYLTEHRWGLYGLEPKTQYEVKFLAMDKIANELESPIISFKTQSANLAFQKPVEGTFVFYPPDDNITKKIKNPLTRIVDNDTNYFTGMVTSGEVSESDQWIVVDLKKNENLSSVMIYWRGLAYSQDYALQISSDGKKWKKIENVLDATRGYETRSVKGDPMIAQEIKMEGQGRYVRLLIKKNSKLYCFYPNHQLVQLMELKIFGK